MTAETAFAGKRRLEQLLNPISAPDFLSQYWQKKPLLVQRSDVKYFDDLLTIADLDNLLSNIALPASNVNLGQNAMGVPLAKYTRGAHISAVDVMRFHREGNTIILRAMHFWLPKLRALCESMEELFLCDAQTNVYLTPANTQSSYPHWDAHDIFVIQIAGTKRWVLHDCEMQLPLPSYEFDQAKHPVGGEIAEIRLSAGDIAYIPRGIAHSPKADDYSVHISLGVKVKTWADLLAYMLEDSVSNTRLCREALPINFDDGKYWFDKCIDALPQLARLVMADRRLMGALMKIENQFLAGRRANTNGMLTGIAQSSTLHLDTIVHIPEGSFVRVDSDTGEAILNGVRLRFDRGFAEPFEFLGETGTCRVRDLPAESDEHRLALAQRLVDEGCLVACAG